jgi:hypothetical protein
VVPGFRDGRLGERRHYRATADHYDKLGRYSATFAIPNVQGKTIGTGATDVLRTRFWLSSGATFKRLGRQHRRAKRDGLLMGDAVRDRLHPDRARKARARILS